MTHKRFVTDELLHDPCHKIGIKITISMSETRRSRSTKAKGFFLNRSRSLFLKILTLSINVASSSASRLNVAIVVSNTDSKRPIMSSGIDEMPTIVCTICNKIIVLYGILDSAKFLRLASKAWNAGSHVVKRKNWQKSTSGLWKYSRAIWHRQKLMFYALCYSNIKTLS